jgi:hypothetical protein
MSCNIAIGANRTEPCNNLNGGLEEFYPFNYIEDAFTVVDGIATAMNVALTVAYNYLIVGDANALTQVKLVDAKTGNSVVTQTVVTQLKKIDGATNDELEKLAEGKISGVLKDRNGIYHWIGAEKGFNLTSTIEAISGGTKQDFNGYNITLVAENKKFGATLDATATAAFLAIVTA